MNPRRTLALKLAVLARQLRASFDQSMEEIGLTRAQWTLIATVARHPGATQRILAGALEVREITAGRLIDRLCEDGYLTRVENPSDRRAYCVHLAPAAQPLVDKVDELAKEYETRIFAGFEGTDLERLEALLDAISRNVSASRTPPAAAK